MRQKVTARQQAWNTWMSRAIRGALKSEPRRSWWMVPAGEFARAARAEEARLAQENSNGRAVSPVPYWAPE